MATLEQKPRIELEVVLKLNETEARFLEGLSGFDHKKLYEALRGVAGTHYTEPFIGGFYSFMEAISTQLPGILKKTDDARAVFRGQKVAENPKRPPAVEHTDSLEAPHAL